MSDYHIKTEWFYLKPILNLSSLFHLFQSKEDLKKKAAEFRMEG